MQFQFNTDNNINADQGMAVTLEAIVRNDLEHFGDRLTRVEIHVSDENGQFKGGAQEKKCVIEARLAGLDPRSATHKAGTVEEAVTGASGKIKRHLESTLGKLRDKHHEKLTALEEE